MKRSRTLSHITKARCGSNDITIIPLVSTEKWEQIFSYLTQKEVAEARLVCPYWRNIIDTTYKFSITIKEKPFEQLPVPFKVKTCCIHQLKKHVKETFKYPNDVETLNLFGELNPSTLRNIFMATTNLTDLFFTNIYDLKGTEIYIPYEPIRFKKILQLGIIHQRGRYVEGNALPINTGHIFFYQMPLIKRLYVSSQERWNVERFLPSFFRFLAKHSKTIEQLRASFLPDLTYGYPGVPPIFQEMFHEEEAQNLMQKLQDPNFQMTTLILALPTVYSSLWEGIIENQRKLVTFYIECIENDTLFTTTRIPFNEIQPTLDRNASTLVTLHLAGLILEENQNIEVDPRLFIPIDGLVFRDFNKLRRLILKRNLEDYQGHSPIQPDVTTITNIHAIPSALLEVLEIKRFYCETSELETLVEKASRLKIVIFHYTGVSIGKGATTGIIDNLTKKSDIHIIDVFPLKKPHNDFEWKNFIELGQKNPHAVRLHGRHYYFNFDRLRKGLEQEDYKELYKHPFE